MNNKLLNRWAIGLVSVVLPFVTIGSKTTAAELKWRISFDEGYANITVPDRNITARYIGRIRKYDFHIAKMFEVTNYMCATQMVSPGIEWSYKAGGGAIDMGRFYISCQLADIIANAYTVRRPQPTVIYFSQGEGSSKAEEYAIGILDIERDPNKTTRWLKFTQRFKPLK